MLQYGFKVVKPNAKQLAEWGFGKVAHLPVIFDSEPGYAKLPSRFLMDRGLGTWDPRWRGSRSNPRLPSRVSMNNFAYWLCNALEWAEVRAIDLMTCDYTTILIGRYQQEMLKGIWSLRGEPLAAQTVNARVDIALEFQMWCADKGYREPFLVPTVTHSYSVGSHANSKSHEAKVVDARKGKVKTTKRHLAFPTTKEIRLWRKRIYDQPVVGAVHGLMVDHVLETAIRREELACWRVDTLPLDPKDWRIINPSQPETAQHVAVDIEKGTKGREYYIDQFGDKVGPKGTIQLPLSLCLRIHQYRNGDRLVALKHLTRGVRNLAKVRQLIDHSVHLYINPNTGLRYTGDQIYQLWTKVEGPWHWSPHLGRDWWACQYLLQKMQEHVDLIKQLRSITSPKADHPLMRALRDTVLQVIQLEIKPQLRHVSSTTTEIYLLWLFNELRAPLDITRKWQEED